jgi:hypothetical protein
LNPRPKDYETAQIGFVGCCNRMLLRVSELVSVDNYGGKLSQVSQICPKESVFLAVLWLCDSEELNTRFPARAPQTLTRPRRANYRCFIGCGKFVHRTNNELRGLSERYSEQQH